MVDTGRHETDGLRNRPDRCPVGIDRAADPAGSAGWAAAECGRAGDRERDLLPAAERLHLAAAAARPAALGHGALLLSALAPGRDLAEGSRCAPDRGAGGCGPGAQPERRDQDRKSTRLNSSHPSISYAVFCLKKKTN